MTPSHAHIARSEILREEMERADIDALLVYGNAWHADSLRYATDFGIQEGQALALVGKDGVTTLLLDDRAEADRARFEELAPTGAVSVRDRDTAQAAALSAASERDRVRAGLDAARDQGAVIRARRATLDASRAQAEAAQARATAALALARQDLDHTLIRAPIDGVVADRQVAPGDYVQPGTRLLTVAPLSALYLTANFKETQVARMRPGQAVRIRLDALPGQVLTGRVDSLAPGTGSQFSLLPFEPGAGNFTKIVQRVPVRIAFDPGQAAVATLRPGLSAQVTVVLRK